MIRPHIIGIRKAVVGIESMIGGQEFWKVTQVPLADAGCGVILLFANFCEGHFGGGKPHVGVWSKSAGESHSLVIAAGD